MIHALRLRNFKGIRRADVALERLTVIVGPNASGKTSFLEALHQLGEFGIGEKRSPLPNRIELALLYRRGASGEEMELSCSGDRGRIRLRAKPLATLADGLSDPLESIYAFTSIVDGAVSEESGAFGDWRALGEIPALGQIFRPADLLRLDPSRLAEPSSNAWTRVGRNGQGLASALTFMALNQPDDFQQIQQHLRAVVPAVERIRFDRKSVKSRRSVIQKSHPLLPGLEEEDWNNSTQILESILFDFRGAPTIPAQLASEGTLLVLGLLTALVGQGRPDLILLDDIDHGLHPRAQRDLIGLLRGILEQDPNLQIVATSHSPYLLDNLRPEEVRLTNLDDDGTVSIAGLTDHPDFDKWRDEMAPGEMWSLFGEKWVGEVAKPGGDD